MGYVANTNNNEFTIPTKNNQKKSMIQLNQEPAPTIEDIHKNKYSKDIPSGLDYLESDTAKQILENEKKIRNTSISSILGQMDFSSWDAIKKTGAQLAHKIETIIDDNIINPITDYLDAKGVFEFIGSKLEPIVNKAEDIYEEYNYNGKYLQLNIKKTSKDKMQPQLDELNERFLNEDLKTLNEELEALGYTGKEITSLEEAEAVVEELIIKLEEERDSEFFEGIIHSLGAAAEAKNNEEAKAKGYQTNPEYDTYAVDMATEAYSEAGKIQAQINKLNEILAPYKYEKEQIEFMYMYAEYESKVAEDNGKAFNKYLESIDAETFQSELTTYAEEQYKLYEEGLKESEETAKEYDTWYIENYMNLYYGYVDEKYSEWKIEKYYSTEYLKDKQALEFFDESEVSTYNYIYETEGKKAAEEYLDFMSEELNRREGEKLAQEYLAKLDGSGSDYVYTAAEGFVEGLESFGTGIANWVIGDEKLDVSDYEQMYVLQEISTNEKYKPFLDDVYQISNSVGNMAIPVIASAAVSLVSKTAGVSLAGSFSSLSTSAKILKTVSVVSQVSFGVSAGGNAYDQALESGNGEFKSALYGIAIGTSEALLEKFLGGIPGLSNANKGLIMNVVSEAGEEWIQTYVETALGCAILKDDFASVDWSEKFKEANQAAIYGMITAGVMNGASMTVDGVAYTVTDLKFLLESKTAGTYFKSLASSEVKGKSLEEILSKKDPDMYLQYLLYKNGGKFIVETSVDETGINEIDNIEMLDVNETVEKTVEMELTDEELNKIVTDKNSANNSNLINTLNKQLEMGNVQDLLLNDLDKAIANGSTFVLTADSLIDVEPYIIDKFFEANAFKQLVINLNGKNMDVKTFKELVRQDFLAKYEEFEKTGSFDSLKNINLVNDLWEAVAQKKVSLIKNEYNTRLDKSTYFLSLLDVEKSKLLNELTTDDIIYLCSNCQRLNPQKLDRILSLISNEQKNAYFSKYPNQFTEHMNSLNESSKYEMLKTITDTSLITQHIYDLNDNHFAMLINEYSSKLIKEIYENSDETSKARVAMALSKTKVIELSDAIDLSTIDLNFYTINEYTQLYKSLKTKEKFVELLNNKDAYFFLSMIEHGGIKLNHDYVFSLLNDNALKKFMTNNFATDFVIDRVSSQIGRVFDLVDNQNKVKIIESGKMSVDQIANKLETLSDEDLDFINNNLERKLKNDLMNTKITKLIFDYDDSKFLQVDSYAKTDMLSKFKSFFGDLLKNNYETNLNESHYYLSKTRFGYVYGFDSTAMAYNDKKGSFYNLDYAIYILKSNIVHESVHEVARNDKGISGFYISREYLGINECVTELFSEFIMEEEYPTNLDGQIHCGYQLGAEKLKLMLKFGIFDVDQLKTSYMTNNVDYFKTVFSEDQLNTFLKLFNDVINSDQKIKKEAGAKLDVFILDYIISQEE